MSDPHELSTEQLRRLRQSLKGKIRRRQDAILTARAEIYRMSNELGGIDAEIKARKGNKETRP